MYNFLLNKGFDFDFDFDQIQLFYNQKCISISKCDDSLTMFPEFTHNVFWVTLRGDLEG